MGPAHVPVCRLLKGADGVSCSLILNRQRRGSGDRCLHTCGHMPDLLLRRLAHLALICCILVLTTLIGWGSFAYMAWSVRHLSAELDELTADRNQLVAERDEARSNFDQISRSFGASSSSKRSLRQLGRSMTVRWGRRRENLNSRQQRGKSELSSSASRKFPRPVASRNPSLSGTLANAGTLHPTGHAGF